MSIIHVIISTMAGNEDFLNKFPVKTKREPKIIVFEEKKKSIRVDDNQAPGVNRKRKRHDDSVEQNFVDIAREVTDFGMTGFSKKEQRKYKQRYAEQLGAHKKKTEKVPYPILMERIKQRKVKEQKQREREEAMGIFQKKKKEHKTNLHVKHNLGRWVDKSRVGESNAVRRISKRDVKKIENMKI